ncbi:MAG: lipoprotein, partial [Leptospiraceae bacterium]|nr:lipoprotein [Leptospiraceae bacterium]
FININNCYFIKQTYNNYMARIHFSNPKPLPKKKKKIVLTRIIPKRSNQQSYAGAHFSENLYFNLSKYSFNVTPHDFKPKKTGPLNQIGKNEKININKLPTLVSINEEDSKFPPKREDYIHTEPKIIKDDQQDFVDKGFEYWRDVDKIVEICSKEKCEYFLSGYIYQSYTGTILEENISSGTILYLHDKKGNLVTQIHYEGETDINSFEETSEITRLISRKLDKLFSK